MYCQDDELWLYLGELLLGLYIYLADKWSVHSKHQTDDYPGELVLEAIQLHTK